MPPTVFPTGVTIYDPDKAYNCFVSFDGRDGHAYLIDMNGNDVKIWPYCGMPAEIIDPANVGGQRGHVLLQKERHFFFNETLLELDWDDNVVWEWGEKAPGGAAQQSHDVCRLANGNTLVLSRLPRAVPEISDDEVIDQAFREVTPDGDIVWEWRSADHIDEFGLSSEQRELLLSKTMRPRRTGLLALNNMAPLGANKWFDGGDQRFHPDNIMTCSRDGNFIAIIAKSSGEIVWQMGPGLPGSYDFSAKTFIGDLPRPVDSTSGQHDAHIIPPGNPGAGNVLIFDNQGTGGFPPVYLELFQGSRVIEVDPMTMEIVWQYDGLSSGAQFWTFMSYHMSSARRLPNGNTLICEGDFGRLFQVTAEGEIVWEYVNPHFVTEVEPGLKGKPNAFTSIFMAERNWVYRAQPVPYDWIPAHVAHSEEPVRPPPNPSHRVTSA